MDEREKDREDNGSSLVTQLLFLLRFAFFGQAPTFRGRAFSFALSAHETAADGEML